MGKYGLGVDRSNFDYKTKLNYDLIALLNGREVEPTPNVARKLERMKAIDFSRTTLASRRKRRANALEHTKPKSSKKRVAEEAAARRRRVVEEAAARNAYFAKHVRTPSSLKKSQMQVADDMRRQSETAAMLRGRRAASTANSGKPVWLAALAGLPSGTPAQAVNRRMAPPRSARTPKAIAVHRKTHAKAIRKASRNPHVAVPALANIGGANSSSSGSGSGSRNAYSWSTDSTSRGVRARSRDSVPRTGELDWIDDVDDTADSAAIAYGRDYAHYLTNSTLERPPSPPFLARPPSPPSHAFLQNRALQNRVTRKRKRSRCARKRPASRRR